MFFYLLVSKKKGFHLLKLRDFLQKKIFINTLRLFNWNIYH